jgi:DNA-binding NarL/FixJ family response regulator
MSGVGIVIVYHDALFGKGLASLLRADGAVQVLDVLAGDAAAAGRVRALEPAVVVLEGDRPEGDDGALLELLLEAAPCVVQVGLGDDTVAVHQRTQVRHTRRFVSLIARLARQARLGRERRATDREGV